MIVSKENTKDQILTQSVSIGAVYHGHVWELAKTTYKNEQENTMGKSFKHLIYMAFIMGLSNTPLYAQDAITVEWAPFIKAVGVDDQQLITAADIVNAEFLTKQNGFIGRELVKKNDAEYADILHWRTKVDAQSAAEKVFNCVPCGGYFALMDMEASATAGAGFSHYDVLKKW